VPGPGGPGPEASPRREPGWRRGVPPAPGAAGGPAVLAQQAEHPLALAAGIAGGQAFGHGVADLLGVKWRAVAPGARDGIRARGLSGDHRRHALEETGLAHLAEAAGARAEDLPHRDRHHDAGGRPPARLRSDLPGQRLLALLLVGVARGAAVEEEALVDETVPESDEIVVDAFVEDEIARGGRHVEQLGSRGALVGEDERAQAGPRRVGRDR